jgi:hypothetical protein
MQEDVGLLDCCHQESVVQMHFATSKEYTQELQNNLSKMQMKKLCQRKKKAILGSHLLDGESSKSGADGCHTLVN